MNYVRKRRIVTALIILLAAAITAASVLLLFEMKKNKSVKFEVDYEKVGSVSVNCYPALYNTVTITDEKTIKELCDIVNGKEFVYWGSLEKRNKKCEGIGGGYTTDFKFNFEDNNKKVSFGYDFIAEGYTVIKDGEVYVFDKNKEGYEKLDELCKKIVSELKEKQNDAYIALVYSVPERIGFINERV